MSADREVLLEVDDIHAGFGAQPVLHGVSMRVHRGEIAAVLGLNGAGKSVTLKVLGGILPAWTGHVRFAGEDITRAPAEERVARGIAHVPQGRQVFPELTVEQNLRVGAYALRRRDRSRYDDVLDGVLARFPRLAERRRQAAGTLSGGEQAMLAVGRALMSEPKLVFVDEASAGLAPLAVRALFDTLREVNRSGVTILMVEQNVTFTLGMADRAHIMQQGRIVYEGEVASLDTERVATLLGVGRLLGRHVAASAAQRAAPTNGSPRRAARTPRTPRAPRAPRAPRTKAAAATKRKRTP